MPPRLKPLPAQVIVITGATSGNLHVRRTSLLLEAQKQPLTLPLHAAAEGARLALRLAGSLRAPRRRRPLPRH